MKKVKKITGAVLPTVIVVSILLLLTVLTVASLWESDFLFFSRQRYEAIQRANIESGFTLYSEYPETVMQSLDEDGSMLLYDSLPHSRIKIERTPWGLYEVVTIHGQNNSVRSSKILGKRAAYVDDITFFYRNDNAALTLTGKTHLKGRVYAPRSGIIYGQMGSIFFEGEKTGVAMIKESDKELPKPQQEAVAAVEELRNLIGIEYPHLSEDSLRYSFVEKTADIFLAEGKLEYLDLSGKLILTGREIEIAHPCRFNNIIVVGENIRIKEGFAGSLQAFATDSIHIESNVRLNYPSGLYSEKYIDIGDNSEVNGYVIVNLNGELDVRNVNYKQSRLATVRGLLYVCGIAQLQGIVSGSAFLDKAVYFSSRGYYENMIYDATVLENTEMAAPLWLSGPPERKEVKWVY
jgi:hypothetical protein